MDPVVAERLQGTLSTAKARVMAFLQGLVSPDDPFEQRMLEYPRRGGKGLRPAFCLAACRSIAGTDDPALPSAATLELYHNAFLVHDDIEDGGLRRRGGPTLHRMFDVPTAVNVGDGMLALGLRPLLDNTAHVGLGPALDILREFQQLASASARGQMTELDWIREKRWDLATADYVAMVSAKTGRYSFVSPMRIGAMAGRASPEVVSAFTAYGQALGVGFQIVDDLLSLTSTMSGKDQWGDLKEGKRTLILLEALREAEPTEAQRIVGIMNLDASERTDELVTEVLTWLRQGNGMARARAVANSYFGTARAALRRLEGSLHSPGGLQFFHDIIAYITSHDPEFDQDDA